MVKAVAEIMHEVYDGESKKLWHAGVSKTSALSNS